jgi:trigger factor
MVMDFYQKNPSALASLRGNVYEEKIIDLIKSKAKSNKKDITKEEAEKILKAENEKSLKNQAKPLKTDVSKDKKITSTKKTDQVKKAKSVVSKSKKIKKVSKK